MGFEECASSAACRHEYQFARWGNLMVSLPFAPLPIPTFLLVVGGGCGG